MKLQNEKFYQAFYSNGISDLTTGVEIKKYCSKNKVAAKIYWCGGQVSPSTFQGTFASN
jgi:hypothetical protein